MNMKQSIEQLKKKLHKELKDFFKQRHIPEFPQEAKQHFPDNQVSSVTRNPIMDTPHSVKQQQLKYDLHNELQIRYKEFFESRFAIELLKSSEKFPSINQISKAIINFIESHKKTVLALIQNNSKITAELKEPYFGSCYGSREEVTPQEVLEKICSTLTDPNADLSTVIQMHCIFVHRIYDHLEKKNEKAALFTQIFSNALFNKENRGRIEINGGNAKPTTQLGISKHPVFTKQLPQSDRGHARAIDRYGLNSCSTFFNATIKQKIPVVCGPSGHTGSLMLGALLYGNLSTEQLREYALISFAFLTAGGNHSFHEVMVIANLAGVETKPDDYATSVPPSIRQTKAYAKLARDFPEFLSNELPEKHDVAMNP
jgi:hypothetical protein